MKSKERAEVLLVIAAICLLAASLLPIFFKTLFVAPTGSIKINPPWIIGILVFAYLFKQPWLGMFGLLVCRFEALVLVIIIAIGGFHDNRTSGLCFLLGLVLVSLYILEDKEVRFFLDARSTQD